MFRAHRAHHQERHCVNTTSGRCHSVYGCVVCRRHSHRHRV